jgi:hypothetical protein
MCIHEIDVSGGKVRFRRWIFGIVALFLVFVLLAVVFKKCTALGKFAEKDEYQIPKEEGLINNSKLLFDSLLVAGDTGERITDLESLNRRYPALEFALPYEWSSEAYKEDIRLVGIKPEFIEDEKQKTFYYNSRLPELLKQQRKNLDKKIFDIDLQKDGIRNIKLIPSMFKVALTHNPWTGKITGKACELFPDSDYVFLICENSMLPIRKSDRDNSQANQDFYVRTNANTHFKELQKIENNRYVTVDYYNYYTENQDASTRPVKIFVNNEDFILIKYSRNDLLSIETHGATIKMFDRESGIINLQSSNHAGNIRYNNVQVSDNVKILIYKGNNKLSELLLTRENPVNNLSYLIQTNHGRQRIAIDTVFTDIYTQQIARNIQERTNAKSPDLINLSIDHLFSKSMEKELRNYFDTLSANNTRVRNSLARGERFEISLTVMNTATGEVLAAPFVTTRPEEQEFLYSRRNPNLVRRYIGSTFKPLMSLAAILTYPDLINLNTQTMNRNGTLNLTNNGESAVLAGFRLRKSFSNEGSYINFWSGSSNLTEYLYRSDDVYPVVLATYALNHRYNLQNHRQRITNIYNLNGNSDCFKQEGIDTKMLPENRDNIYKSGADEFMFVKLLDVLYGINSREEEVDNIDYKPSYYVWRHLQDNDIDIEGNERPLIFDEISPNVTNMRYNTWKNNSLSTELRPWILGQGNNEWCNMKVAEAWARMASKRAVKASLIKTPLDKSYENLVDLTKRKFTEDDSVFYNSTHAQINNVWNRFLDNFESAQSQGTLLQPFRSAVINELGQNFVCLSKTGTPDFYPRSDIERITHNKYTYDIGMFSFALMTQNQFDGIQEESLDDTAQRGIVCVLRIVHTYPHVSKSVDETKSIISSPQARDFYNGNRLRKIYNFTRSCFR